MKKLISILAITTMLFTSLFMLSGCGDEEKSSSSKKNKNKEDNEVVENVVENKESSNTIANKTDDSEDKKEKKVSEIDKTPVDYKNKDSYYFVVDGKKFTIDTKLSEITEKTGFTQDSAAIEKDVPSKNYLIGGGYFHNAKKRTVFSVMPINLGSESVKTPETTVGGFSITKYNYEELDETIEICNGITIGTSMDDVVAVFGEPTEKDMREDYENLGIKYTYKDGAYKYFEFEFDKQTKVVTNITWRYFNF